MRTRAYIIGDSTVVLWGISSRERLRRQLASLPEVKLVESRDELSGAEALLLLRADYLYEVRTLTALMTRHGVLECAGIAAAAHVTGLELDGALAALEGGPSGGLERFDVEALQSFESSLRRTDPPTLAPLLEENRIALSNRLYGSAYKGITDLVTKFWWPKPAKQVVAWCAERQITPNVVTVTGLLRMCFAGWCFYEGAFVIGLIAGWIMTFLDTVDGKLARVTVMSSRVGHWLDHGMDIVHPPFWYWLWGLGLTVAPTLWGLEAATLYVWIFVGYLGGRAAEGLFHSLGELSLFTWRPFDAYFRLITGRRNPCLILLTLFTLVGRPDWGFLAVVIWTVASTVVLIVRLLQGLAVRQYGGEPLTSWMADAERAAREHPRAFRTFSTTRSAYGGE
ncbi:MAG TPA: CDP-alcohol phosphatidyltransferase family protein [Pseudomonadales bacterium]